MGGICCVCGCENITFQTSDGLKICRDCLEKAQTIDGIEVETKIFSNGIFYKDFLFYKWNIKSNYNDIFISGNEYFIIILIRYF